MIAYEFFHSSYQIDIAVAILSALLTGGFILFFIESQHIDQNVRDRYRAIMDPFYEKLTALMVVCYFLEQRYVIKPVNSKLEQLIKKIARKGGTLFASSHTLPYLKNNELEALCFDINNIWYYFDRGQSLEIVFEKSNRPIFRENEIYSKIKEISILYSELEFNDNLLPEICGRFYGEKWQPLEGNTFRFEQWEKKSRNNRLRLLLSISYILVLLLVLLLFAFKINFFYIAVFTIIGALVFIYNIFSLGNLLKLSNEIF